MIHTHQTAPTQFVEANGIRFAYRRFGKAGGVPIVFNQHYTGTMDYWDPAVTDGLARDREVILFNNAGVSSSSGEVPTTFEQMGANAVAFSRGWCYPSNALGRFMLLSARSRNRGAGKPKRALWCRERPVLNVDQGGIRATDTFTRGNRIIAASTVAGPLFLLQKIL